MVPFRSLREALIPTLPRLRRFTISLTRSVPRGEDLMQSTCQRALEREDSWDRAKPLEPWLYTIARNLWISEIRKDGTRRGQGVVDAAESDELQDPATPEDRTYGNQLMRLVHGLPEGQASVLLLVSVEGRSYQEAADILGIPAGTVMSRMSNARKALRAKLEASTS